ncbi:hypothetical protein An02g07680 [Aspergillus niger]|uniref:Uncharacterized protein n=2 Tax=Aspergillus niger TaxID=5061 RepID=A2QDN0_ASPNC|nr:hypothetical protein An02g07680 [Aspergillus niger]CAK37731.1 hypothetical protein An02g07680 [Aspergillus niger]
MSPLTTHSARRRYLSQLMISPQDQRSKQKGKRRILVTRQTNRFGCGFDTRIPRPAPVMSISRPAIENNRGNFEECSSLPLEDLGDSKVIDILVMQDPSIYLHQNTSIRDNMTLNTFLKHPQSPTNIMFKNSEWSPIALPKSHS